MGDAALGDLDRRTRECLADLPPTASLVYLELYNADGPRTLRQLTYQMARPERSILRALRQLHDEDLVSCSPRHTDPPSSEWEVDG
ncbi:MarR family transcriptional regulator [Halorubrum sp. Atlit-26R]|uniref:MarR family transcriptional regulator n=1 Tax=Halorubrum sp. Atlit-26R TaxID=2282128 RepID=UPI000EF1DB70|nr:MarR family transcriptional regulator [Halorubrum sp. Atlit-26R]RLM67649.1 MarR family transcriptional regulator [Halorubrum sp. Atlit-26R]